MSTPQADAVPAAAPSALALAIAQVAVDAGAAAMRHFRVDCPHASKGDGSPVTLADEEAEAVILAGLAQLDPDLVVVAEESCAKGRIPQATGRFALVDPVDGTREFLACEPEFTVNVALIEAGAPVLGCVYAPALGALYLGIVGDGAWKAQAAPGEAIAAEAFEPMSARRVEAGALTALVSRSSLDPDTEAYLAGLAVRERVALGSSLKFCRIAEGAGDIYPRLQRVMEWDIAAGHAVLAAAGGRVDTLDGAPVRYGQAEQGFRAPMFIAWGRSAEPTLLP